MSEPTTRPGCINCETGEYEENSGIPLKQPIAGVNVNGSGNSTSTSFSWAKVTGNKDMVLGILLGIAIIEGAALFYEWRHKAQQSELQRYELSDFQTTHFNPLAAQVAADHDLIQAYGLQKSLIETCKGK